MNSIKITLLLIFIFTQGISQNTKYEYPGRLTPSIKKETLNFAKNLTDITPELHRYLNVAYSDRLFLDQQLRSVSGYIDFAKEQYNTLLDFEFVEITANCLGVSRTLRSAGNILTADQKSLLNNADVGSEIYFILRFKYKNLEHSGQIINGYYTVTVVPDIEASYPGGFERMSEYINQNILGKVTGKENLNKILQTIVKFTIDEKGRIVNARISRSSADPAIDRLVLDVIGNMPVWNPAKNATGIKVKQDFSIPFSKGC